LNFVLGMVSSLSTRIFKLILQLNDTLRHSARVDGGKLRRRQWSTERKSASRANPTRGDQCLRKLTIRRGVLVQYSQWSGKRNVQPCPDFRTLRLYASSPSTLIYFLWFSHTSIGSSGQPRAFDFTTKAASSAGNTFSCRCNSSIGIQTGT